MGKQPATAPDSKIDVLVVGAGMAGLCMLEKLRSLKLSAVVIEAGSGVGGAWYWNRYPGCRCDVPSVEYSLGFSDALQQEWNWTERMASQAEIEAYLNHVADKFDLRDDILFDTRVTAAAYDEQRNLWEVTTDSEQRFESQFLIMATGGLSEPYYPDIPGAEQFQGNTYHTARWPGTGVDLRGKRVGVIGSGSSGVQLIQTIAPEVKSLVAFQRSPAYVFPAKNVPMDPDYLREVKANYSTIRKRQRNSFDGVSYFRPSGRSKPNRNDRRKPSRKLLDIDEAQQQQELDEFGLSALSAYVDVHFNPEADERARQLFRSYLFDLIKNPQKAEALLPEETPLRCKRQVLGTNYYETFNLDHVDIVRLREDTGFSMTAEGARTASQNYELDVIVYATGFDAVTGPLTSIDIRGRDNQSLKQVWETSGVESYLGLQVSGFPNLFTITGPTSPSVLSNLAYSIEFHVDWIGECLSHLKNRNIDSIEAPLSAQNHWAKLVDDTVQGRMYVAPTCKSWYLGSNIPGKERRFLIYVGGCDKYAEHCANAAANGYQGFTLKPDPM